MRTSITTLTGTMTTWTTSPRVDGLLQPRQNGLPDSDGDSFSDSGWATDGHAFKMKPSMTSTVTVR